MPELLDRRRRDLEQQLDVLPTELTRWAALTAQGQPFEKHASQIDALSRQMRALIAKVASDWDDKEDFVAIQVGQRNCAAVHALWSYYRAKFLMRLHPELGLFLRSADAYVWACYQPVLAAQQAAQPETAFRSPPLVTFDVERSAWALSRFANTAAIAAASEPLDAALSAMPLALLGIPWQTAELLPNLAVLSHETGHVVDSDFAFADRIRSALADALAASDLCDGWSYFWRKEVFADFFGCYTAGPSFVWALADLIPDSPERTRTKTRPGSDGDEEKRWGRYPPATLRMLLNIHALRELGHADAADAITSYWRDDYPTHAMAAYEDDVKRVVAALLAIKCLPENVNYRALINEEVTAHHAAKRGNDLPTEPPYDPRTIVAIAGRLDRQPPAALDRAAMWTRLQNYIVTVRPAGTLGPGDSTGTERPSRLRTDDVAKALFVNRDTVAAAPGDGDDDE